MIYIDIAEHYKVKNAFFKFFPNGKEKIIGSTDCKLHKLPFSTTCITETSPVLADLVKLGNTIYKAKCEGCKNKKYIRYADFEIGEKRAYYERKTASDFSQSMKGHLIDQMDRMDTFLEGRKGIILEGMREHIGFNDSKPTIWEELKDGKRLEFKELSPLEQAIKINGNKNWVLSYIREIKMRNLEFVQTWDLNETFEFLKQCDLGYDHESAHRFSPKRIKKYSIEQNLLMVFNGIGKVTSEKMMKKPEIMKALTNLVKVVGKD